MPSGESHNASARPEGRGLSIADADSALAADSTFSAIDEQFDALADNARSFALVDFAAPSADESAALEQPAAAEQDLRIELGRTQMCLEDVLKLRAGSVVALDSAVGAPVDIIAGGQCIARGEVVVINERFCVRVVQLTSSGPSTRVK